MLADLKDRSTDESTTICTENNMNTVIIDSIRIQDFKKSRENTQKKRATQDSFVKGNVFDLIEQNLHCIHKEVKTRKHGKGEWVNTRELYNLMVSTTMVNLTCLSTIVVL